MSRAYSLSIVTALLLLAGCDRDPQIRVYDVPVVESSAGSLGERQVPTGRIPGRDSQTSGPSAAPKVTYKVPEGWQDDGPKGMRAASFSIPSKTGKIPGLTTVIFASGNTRSNILRWQGQLTPALNPEVQERLVEEAIANGKEIVSANGQRGKYYRLTTPPDTKAEDDDEATPVDQNAADSFAQRNGVLAAILPISGEPTDEEQSSVFVKLTCSEDDIESQREPFVLFVESLAW
jgi:hypothetical protein